LQFCNSTERHTTIDAEVHRCSKRRLSAVLAPVQQASLSPEPIATPMYSSKAEGISLM